MELDRLRNAWRTGDEAEPAAEPTPPEPLPEPPPEPAPPAIAVTVDGVVLRSDGHQLAWVNGVETAAGGGVAAEVGMESELAPDGRLRLRLPGGREGAVLKPGQTMNEDGQVLEAFERPASAWTRRPIPEADSRAVGPGESPEPVPMPSAPADPASRWQRGTLAAPASFESAASGVRIPEADSRAVRPGGSPEPVPMPSSPARPASQWQRGTPAAPAPSDTTASDPRPAGDVSPGPGVSTR